MPQPPETNGEEKINFKWGNKREVGFNNKHIQYESFTFRDVEYFLYDCVYFYHNGDFETSIGKLVEIYETPRDEKMVKVIWLLRPPDIRYFLGDYRPRWNELFLACGEGDGVSNVNFLGSILGKCNVVCTAKDKRNLEPSEAEVEMADFFFKHCFNVELVSITDKFADLIGGVKVEEIFNRKKVKISNPISRPSIVIKKRTDPSGMLRHQFDDKAEVKPDIAIQKNTLLNCSPYKKRKTLDNMQPSSQSKESTKKEDFDKRRKVFHEGTSELRLSKVVRNCREFMEVTGRPGNEKRRWFLRPNWEEKLRNAQESGCLILLNNLDPSCTSYEVEDLIWHTLNEIVDAKMIEWSPTSNPHYGRAFVVFKKKDAAESALSRLNKRCLILGDGRVVSAVKGWVRGTGEQTNFPGHLVMNKSELHKQTEDMRNAVSTSHCAQPNTIEFGMAFGWRKLQHLSDKWWDALYQAQKEEINDVMSGLTIKCNF
ncbi:hypothetical protein QN277_024280 [Acacia crassicarpa]|uniref:BAH domain-containing protein n=1 Tax=Acacia crassicarpa TaxID=499986 RepID=A0AAE1JBL7_9FABA|nr:hypothetical protein QN277_024280 [Acacia crassicarpa]